jgi:hypothetical protein
MAIASKDPSERIIVTFDFGALATAVSAPVVSVESAGGAADATPAAMLSGSPTITDAKVLQLVVGGVANADYKLRCQADDGAQRYVVADVLQVRPA